LINLELKQGDSIRTLEGRAELSFIDGSKISLKENTNIDFAKMRDKNLTGKTLIKQWAGKIKVKFRILKDDSTLEVWTKNIIAAVKGTEFVVDARENDTVLSVLEGIVSMEDPSTKKEFFVKAGERASYSSLFLNQPQPLDNKEKEDAEDEWLEKTAEAPAVEDKKPVTEQDVTSPASAPKVVPETESQDKPKKAAKAESTDGGFGGTFGAVSVDGKVYYMLSLLYELSIDKFGIGFDVRLLWNDDGIKEDDWNDWKKSLANSFRYIRYGHKGEEIYAKFGVLDGVTLGHGFIVRQYTNMGVDIYNRKFGTQLDLNLGGFGIETLTNDALNERMGAARVYIDLIPGLLQAGATGVYDVNPSRDKYTTDSMGVKTYLADTPSLTVYGGDLGLQLVKTDMVSLLLYADWAKIKDYGEGYALPGISGKLLMFNYQLERRTLQSDFLAGIIDYLYEERRPYTFLSGGEQVRGWFAELGWKPIEWAYLLGALEKYDGQNPYVRLEAVYKGNLIPKIAEAAAGYEQRDFTMFDVKNPNTVVYTRVGAEIGPGVILALTVKQTYDPLMDRFKRQTIMAVQMKF
jgi:hypothetical protein